MGSTMATFTKSPLRMRWVLVVFLILCAQGEAGPVSRVPELFDPVDFIEAPKLSQKFWTNPANELYGKSVVLWNEADFAALEVQLELQLAREREHFRAEVGRRGLITLDDRLRFEAHTANLEATIETLPAIRAWVQMARAELGKSLEGEPLGTPRPVLADRLAGLGAERAGDPIRAMASKRGQGGRSAAGAGIESHWRPVLIGAAALALFAAIFANWVWVRYFRIANPYCPKCKNTDRKSISANSPLVDGSWFKFKSRRKFYCHQCGYKWIRTVR